MANLIRFSPDYQTSQLQREFDRLFGAFFGPTTQTETDDTATAVWTPRVDLAETPDAYLINLDVPGITKKEIKIDFHEGVLSVSGDRKVEEKSEDKNYVRVERRYGHFYRSFTLPKSIVESKISATLENGVLMITVPKAEEVKPRQIEVK